jgi:hypothetical protein
MSFVTTQPESLAAAARDLYGVGSAMTTHNAAVYQEVSAQAAAVHEAFTTTLAVSAGSYAATEAANATAAG